ncbi:hypothetical protein AAHE18_07G085700 [Arachis hypogaea]
MPLLLLPSIDRAQSKSVFNSKIDEGRKTLQTGKYKWQTYKEVYEVIQKVGSSIRSCGYRQEKKCGIYGANCAGWIISMEVHFHLFAFTFCFVILSMFLVD